MYRDSRKNLRKQDPPVRILDIIHQSSNPYNDFTDAAGLSIGPSSPAISSNPGVENPGSSQLGDVSLACSTVTSDIQQFLPATYSDIPQSASSKPNMVIQGNQSLLEPMDLDSLEPWSSYIVLLSGAELRTEEGNALITPWIYLRDAEDVSRSQEVLSQIFPGDIRPDRARYVKNPEMHAARAFHNALQTIRRAIQNNEAELFFHLWTHHDKTNCEMEMLLSFHEYDQHANECDNCCSALVNLQRRLPRCDLGMRLAENISLAIDWYATATFGDYETIFLQVFDSSARTLLLDFIQAGSGQVVEAKETTTAPLQESAPSQTLAIEPLGIVSSFLGLERETSVGAARRSRTQELLRAAKCGTRRDKPRTKGCSILRRNQQSDSLIAEAELVVSVLDDYLNYLSRRRVLRSQIGQQGMRSIQRLSNVSPRGYNSLEKELGNRLEEKYDFYPDFPNHMDLLNLGIQTFIELNSEKPSYPTAPREIYSVLYLCGGINQTLLHQNSERRRAESFARELKDWRNIIKSDGERSAFERVVQIRRHSQYLQSQRQSSRLLRNIDNETSSQHIPLFEDRIEAGTATSSSKRRLSKIASPTTAKSSNPIAKAMLWMQLFASMIFTTLAAYFSLSHRTTNILALFFTGDDPETLNSSQTINNNSTHLPKNLAWTSSPSIKFMDKARHYIISRFKSPEYSVFSYAIDVAADSLSYGWISTVNGIETLLLQMAKLSECTKTEFRAFVEKVLDLCMTCAANLSQYESHRIAPNGSDVVYNSSYEESRLTEMSRHWIADDDGVPAEIPDLNDIMSSMLKLGSNIPCSGNFSGPGSLHTASLGSSRNLGLQIKSDFLDSAKASIEDRLVSTKDIYFPERSIEYDLSGGPISAYASMLNAPTMDPVLTLENQDNLLALSQSHFPTPPSTKAYSHPPNIPYHSSSNFDSFWNMNRAPVVVSSLPEHAGYYLAQNSGWHFTEDFLGSTSSPSNPYCHPPTSIPVSLPVAYTDNLKPLLTESITASPISPYIQSAETPRFLPIAPTPPPPVPPPKPRKRRRSSSVKEEDDRGSGSGTSQPAAKRQKKTILFKCPICKHDIAAPRMNLTRHIRSVHADSRTRRIECEWPGCATTFQAARKDNYRAHLRKHHEKLTESGNGLG